MNEKEIIDELKVFGEQEKKYKYGKVILGLLDLYQKEKEKNKELEERNTDLLLKLEMKKVLFIRKDKVTKKLLSELYIRKDELEKDYISKDKIKAKIEEIDKEYYEVLSNKNCTLIEQNYNAQRHEAMKMVLIELLEE